MLENQVLKIRKKNLVIQITLNTSTKKQMSLLRIQKKDLLLNLRKNLKIEKDLKISHSKSLKIKDKYESVFTYFRKDTINLLQKGVLKLCICYLQEAFMTDDIIHSIHNNTKKLNIQNSIVIVNDYLVDKRYKDWCKEVGETPRFKTIVFCHSLYEKSSEMYGLLNNHQIYDLAKDYKKHTSSAMSLDDFKNTKSTLRKNTILSMNRRQREHRLATLCVLNHYGLLKGNGVSYQLTFDGPTTPYYVDRLFTDEKKHKKY